MKSSCIVAFVPVLHAGYLAFFKKHPGEIYLLWHDTFPELILLERDLRALSPDYMKKAIESFGIFTKVNVLNAQTLAALQESRTVIVMPNEDVCRTVAEKYFFGNNEVLFDSVFLRWDKTSSLNKVPLLPPDHISREMFDRDRIKEAYGETGKSSDWWRQVGAVAAKNGHVLFRACNEHLPSPHSPYVNGDPRSSFNAGEMTHVSSAHHAEKKIIARAAREGTSLLGADIYVTTFPCADCAMDIAESGIRRVFYAEGYSNLDADGILRSKKVELIFVDMKE